MKLLQSRVQLFHGPSESELFRFEDDTIDSMVTDPPAGIAFMNKAWDKDHGGRDRWIEKILPIFMECHRVLKPGAHGLVWGIPRTSHWTAFALENSGFEVRDVITHHFGSGFPKSMDVSKAIDRVMGVEREDKSKDARKWEGWGTALKPASEHWILVRKPFVGTLVNNTLEYGIGALNIDACRIATTDSLNGGAYAKNGSDRADGYENWRFKRKGEAGSFQQPEGRWPANLILSEEAAAELDQQSGNKCGAAAPVRGDEPSAVTRGIYNPRQRVIGAFHGDSGGASRFFYCPKPSRREREAGLEEFPVWTSGEATGGRKEGSAGLKNPRAGAGRTSQVRNHHPTVKAIALMRYLVKLITPLRGTVLDPFMGSGSTGCACVVDGFNFIGIDSDEAYVAMARARINYWRRHGKA